MFPPLGAKRRWGRWPEGPEGAPDLTAMYSPDPSRYDKMTYARSGRSGLDLPRISLGLWHNFGGASISEDAMRAVPRGLREGAYAMGATKFEVVRKVVVPAALSGIMASIILAMSRAVGETMAVVIAGGTKPQLSFDPLESVQTMTAFIVQISLGDTPQGSVQFYSLFAVAMVLFVMTFVLNLLSAWVVRRFRTAY